MAKLIDTSYEASPVKASPAKAKPVKVKPAKQEPTTTNSRGTNSRGIDPLRQDSEWAQSWAKETRDKAQHEEAKAETEVKPTSTGASGKTFTMPFTPKIVTTNNSRSIDPMKQNAEWARSWAKGVHNEAESTKAEAAAKEKRAELLSVYGDTSKQSATDIFKTTEGGTGGYYGSQHTEELREQLNRFHDKELMPSYSNYQQILKDYNAGKATAAQLEEARLDYASKYYQYAPLYGAYETLRRGNIAVNGDSATLRDSFDRWGAAGEAAENAVTASGERLAQLRADYEKEFTAYQADPAAGRDKLTEAGLKYEEAAGKYNADLFVLQEIVELTGLLGRQSNRAAEREQQEYYDAHPYALRADDTAESIAERTATLKADYEAAESAMQAAGKKYAADSDAEAFGVGAGFSDASKAAYDSTREAYDAARLNYERMQALNDWASDPAHLESRDEWTRNGWTWDDRFFEYQQTGDRSVLDDLVYGYGAFMADDRQRAELTQVLTRQFEAAKANRIPDVATVPREAREASEELYREAQDRLHMVGGVATSARDLADATFWTVVTDIASIGSLALDATTLAVQAFAPETARWMQNWSNGIKADRAWAQEQMSREVANMPYAGAMAIQLVPSVLECIGSAWYAQFLQKASALATPNSLMAIAQYETNIAKASNWANVIQASMQDMARNPQYWTSFARVAGTDYVDAMNDGASQMQAMAYALADGSLNALIEIGGGGIQSLPQVSEELTNPTVRKVLREVYLKSVFDEGMEEVYQGVVERGLSAMLLGSGNKLVGLTDSEADRDAIFSFVSALEEFAGGALVSAIVSPTGEAFREKLGEGRSRETFIRSLNTENLALPEDLRLAPLNVQECTDNEVEDFYLTLALRRLQNNVINESEDYNAAHQTERAAATSYYEEVQQRAEKANPANSVLSPIATELQEKGYGDARGAEVQAELLGKVLDGETLTDAEVRAFELNNDLVRTVFRERTGLTGMPETGDLDAKARRVYIDAARTMANRVKAAQAALAETIAPKTMSKPVSTVAEAQTGSEAASNAAEAISNTPEQVSAFRRRAQKAIRERNVRRREAELQKQNQRQRPIDTEGKSTDEVIRLVRRQSGSDQILTREEFDRVRPAALTSSDEEAKALARLDQAGRYYWYLTNELGLTRAEAEAVVRSQRLTDAAAETYTESENVKEEESYGGREADDDGGDSGRTGGGGGDVLAERAGRGGVALGDGEGELSGDGLEQPSGGSAVSEDADASGPDVPANSPGGEGERGAEYENDGGREAGSDVGGVLGSGGQDGALGHDGSGGAGDGAADGAVPGSESVRGADDEGSVDGSDAARETSDGRVTPRFSEAAEVLENRYHNERIKDWTDAPVSQLSEAEASAFTEAGAWVEQFAGAKAYLLNTKGKGVGLEVAKDLETQQNGKSVKLPPPIARGEFDTTDGVARILVAADLTRTRGFSPARTLTHEGMHALFDKFGGKELRGKLRAKTMSNMTLLKGYNAFKASPEGVPYVEHYKGREDVIYEEYAAKLFAHQYGTEAEQKLITEFVKDNIPGFPIEEYTKQMKALDELYAAPKTVEQAIERKPAPPEALPAPAPGALPAKQESTPAKPRVSKAARELAERFDVDLTQVQGTGKNGSITKADVQRYRAAQAAVPKTETPRAETPKTETPKPISVKPNTAETTEAEPEAPKPIRVRPNTPDWRNETVPNGLTREQAKRIPEELRPAATPEERLDRFAHEMLGRDSGRTVAPEKALQGDTPAAKEAQRLYNATNADIVFVTSEGEARSNRYIRNGSPDVRLREGWSFVTVSKDPEVMLQRVAKAIFDQLSVQVGTPTGENKGIAKPNDMALVERVFHQIRLSGAMDYEIAAIHKAAAEAYAQQAKENGNLHDNWRNIYSTGALDSGDRIAELRALPKSERTDETKAELEWLEEREALLAQATEEELRQLRESEDQIVSYGGEDGSKPSGQVLDRNAEATMQTNFQNWADYQYIRELYALRTARAAMDEQARRDFDVTREGVHARLVYNAMSALYSKNKGKSSLWSRREAGESEAFRKVEARQNAQLRQWCADNLWTQEPQFGKPGKDYGLVMEQLREIFSNAQKRGAKVSEYRTELKNERDRAAKLKRARDSYKTSDVYTLSAEAEAETVASELEGRAELEGRTALTRERLGNEGETDIALGEEGPATGSIEEMMGAAQRVELNVGEAILGELRGDADTSAYLETEEFGALLAEERENRHIPPKPTDPKELYRWQQEYEALDEKAFLAAELRYRDLYGGTEAQMSGEEMQAELTRSYARIRELDGQLTAAEKALDNVLKSWMVQLRVPAGASQYTVNALAQGVAAGQISAENALETVRRIPQQWRADNALTAEDVLHRARVDYTMTPVDVDAEVTETALHDLVEAAEDDAEAGGQKLTEQQNELLNAVAETQQTANPANEERAEMVRDLRDRGATPLNAPVGYTEKTRAYHHDPNGPRRVRRATTSDETGKTYTLDDVAFTSPYDKKVRARVTKEAAREWRKAAGNAVARAAYSDAWEIEQIGFRQTREDNVGVLIKTLRGSADTAGFIFTEGLVTPEGQLVGKSFRDAMLCRGAHGELDAERQAKLDEYRQLLHTVDRMSIVQRAEASVEEYLALYPELKAVSGKRLADMTRINPIAAEYVRRLDWLKNAKDKPVMAVKDTDANDEPIALSAAMAQKLADEMLTKDPWLAAKAQETYDWWDMFMRLYVVGGTVSEEDYNNLRAAYPHYVPTHREDMPGPLAKEFQRAITSWSENISTGKGLKEATGSTKAIRDIPQQQALLVAAYVKSYRVRELCNNIIDELLVDDAGNFREFGHIVWEKTDPLYMEAHEDAAGADGAVVEKSTKGHYLLTTFRNGKRITAELTPGTFRSLKNLLGLQDDWYKGLLRAGNFITSPMKMCITGANINFALRNLAGDIPTALINTQNKDLQYSKAWMQAIEHIYRNSDEWVAFNALGGTHANYMHPDKDFAKRVTKDSSISRKVLETIQKPGEISESITRFAEYLATVRTRGDDYTSRLIGLYRAAEVTVDFGRAGSVTRLLNAWCPYFNPAVQGVAKVFRSAVKMKDGKVCGVNLKTLSRAALASVLPELFMLLWRKLADKEEEFNEVSDYVKDNYYLIPMGDHKWFRVRKNREWAALFGNTLMRCFEGATGYEKPFETYLDISIKGNFLPDFPMIIGLAQVIQLANNENYAGSVIIPSSMDDFKDRVPMAVYDEDTSAVAYLIASLGSRIYHGFNPMAVDYMFHNYFGDFFSNFYDFFTMGDIEHYKENGFDFLELAKDSLLSFWNEEKKAWVTDSRYSNSTVTRYYEMYGDLKANVAAEKYLNGGATGSREEEILAALSNQRYGYSALIQALSKEARSMPDGEEKAEIKGQIVLLARLANDFYERCMSGEITDPVRYIKYHRFGSVVCDELVRLGEAESGYDPESFNFDPTFSCPAYLRDPSNSDKQYTLSGNEELREQFIALQEENYGKAVEKLVLSSDYQKLSKSAQAAALEQQRSIVLAETKEEFLKYLKKQGVKSADRTLASVELAQLEAKYALQRVNSPDTAVSEKVSGELVRLEKYTSEYSFVLSTSVPKTFRDQTDSKRVYTLTPHQQDYYDRERSALYNEALSTVIASSKYRKASDEEKAAMLEAAGSIVDKQLRKEFQSYLDRVGARSALRTTLDDELITEAAGYAVTEILSPDDAYDRKVTDELLRLYGLSNDYSFQPPTNKPKSYVDPKNRSKEYVLTEEQQMAYVRLSREVYNDAVLTIITDPSYARLTDAQKAERLNAMRSSLAAEVKDRFLLWLSQNTTSTDREADKVSKETKRYIKALLGW